MAFIGAIHDFSVPLRKRLESRRYCGPYIHTPAEPGGSRGFYTEGGGERIACNAHGAGFDLRLSYVKRRGRIVAWCPDPDAIGDTMKAITARLPHGRGFLAGWTYGPERCAEIDLRIHEDEESAQRAAEWLTEYAAEKENAYLQEEDARRREEEAEEERRAEEVAGLGTEE